MLRLKRTSKLPYGTTLVSLVMEYNPDFEKVRLNVGLAIPGGEVTDSRYNPLISVYVLCSSHWTKTCSMGVSEPTRPTLPDIVQTFMVLSPVSARCCSFSRV